MLVIEAYCEYVWKSVSVCGAAVVSYSCSGCNAGRVALELYLSF